MVHMAPLQRKPTFRPKGLSALLLNLSILLILVMLAACSQQVREDPPELEVVTLDELIFTYAPGESSQTQEITLRNDAAAPVEITEVSIAGADASAFALAANPALPLTLVPHQQLTLKVRFAPHMEQKTFRAALRITGGHPKHAAVEVDMYGEARLKPGGSLVSDDEAWTPLFNGKNLDGWYTWLPSTGKNNDPKGVFKAENGMLHILDIPVTDEKQEFGYIARPEIFKNYHLRFEYKWGTKRFKPRDAKKRDSGLVYHVVGPEKVWPRSVELQVQEGDTGDLWLLGGTTTTTTVTSASTDTPKYQEGGEPYTTEPGSFVRLAKSGTYDTRSGWNQVEVIVTEDEAVHIVNGKVNNRGSNFRQPDPNNPGKTIPLNEGRIVFQAEGAEVFYRNIEIKPLD
jgi:hypothetical protein